MKLCDYCETPLPDDASACTQCGLDLPGAEDINSRHAPLRMEELTPGDIAVSTEVGDMTIKGWSIPSPIPNPETPVPAIAIIDDLLVPDDVAWQDTAPALEDNTIENSGENQSDSAIILADAPVVDTDPNVSLATEAAQYDDPTPVNGQYPEEMDDSKTLPIMSFVETDEETASQNRYAVPAPLYPDYGKTNNSNPTPLYDDQAGGTENEGAAAHASHTTPAPLYEDYQSASNTATTNSPLLPRKIYTAYPRLWSRRGFIAIALCLLLIASSIGIIVFKNSQSGPPPFHQVAAKLHVLTHLLSSDVIQGSKVILADQIENTGGQPLHWTGSTANTAWLTLSKQSDIIQKGAPPRTIYVTANATTLSVGTFNGAIQFQSNGGNDSIQVSINVLASGGKKQAISTVDPPSITFDTLPQGQQATKTVTIGNSGNDALKWQASTDNPTWLTLSPSAGTVLAGGYPGSLSVTVNTATLSPGAHTAQLKITSNASNTLPPVGITVNVTASSGSALSISANPGSFTNGCLSCTVILTASQGGQGSQPSVQWSTSSTGIAGITFSPSAGTLLANQSFPVTVTIPNTSCPASAYLTFAGAANSAPVLWSCTPPPTPVAILTASPTSLTNCYSCIVNISPAAGSQSNLVWTSGSNGINGITISPPNGTVAPGHTQQVTVNVPQQNCPASASITFSGQGSGNSATVAWTCTAPTPQTPLLSVSPNTLNSSQCSANSGGTYNCQVTLSESPAGNMGWSSYTNVGGTFTPAAGQFSTGQTQATVAVNNIQCTGGTFGFQGQNNAAQVQWNCNPPQPQTPTLSVNPTSLNQNSSACSSDGNGGYNCSVQLSESPQGTLNWSETNNLGVTVSQTNGTLTPGNSSQTVYIYSIPCNGNPGTFTFSAQGSNNIQVNWTACSTPTTPPPPLTLSVSPSSLTADSNCPNNGNGWTCTETLYASSGSGTLSWSISTSSNMPGVTGTAQSGTLAAGGSTTINIYIPTGDCVSGTLYFNGPNTVQVPWNCTPTPTPPPPPSPSPTVVPAMLSFSPSSFPNASGCSYAAGSGWTCIETLSVNADATQNLTWNVSASNPDIQFSSYGGTMSPGQTLPITITIPDRFCPVNAFFLFAATNQGSGVYVNWSCNAVLSSYWNCTAITQGSQYQCTITPYMVSGGQGEMSWIAHTASGALFQPTNGGTVTPNGSLTTVSVTTGCYDTFTIVGQGGSVGTGNTVTINWACK